MAKLMAILNVVAWSGFWAFGYLALSHGDPQSGEVLVAAILAAAGAAVGVWVYLWLARHAEATGYARRPNRAVKPDDLDGTA